MKVCLTMPLLAGTAFAQTPAKRPPPKKAATPAAPSKEAPKEVPSKWPVESITVVGNRNYTREQVVEIAGLKIGQLAGKAEFDAARDRLTATGVFETVGYQFEPGPNKQGFAATFQVTEVEPSYPVRFEELGVPDKDLEALLKSKDALFSMARMPATQPVMDRYTAWIQEYLIAKGLKEKIAGKLTLLGTQQFAILFRPARNLPAIAQITFQGNQVIPQTALREAVHL